MKLPIMIYEIRDVEYFSRFGEAFRLTVCIHSIVAKVAICTQSCGAVNVCPSTFRVPYKLVLGLCLEFSISTDRQDGK